MAFQCKMTYTKLIRQVENESNNIDNTNKMAFLRASGNRLHFTFSRNEASSESVIDLSTAGEELNNPCGSK